MSNVWTILFMFYSTTERQIQAGASHIGIVIAGICVGLIMGTMALLFRKFSYIFTGFLFGLSISSFCINLYNSLYTKPLYMEISYPFTILVVFLTSIYGISGKREYLIRAIAFLGSYYLTNSVVNIIIQEREQQTYVYLRIFYVLITVGMTIFSIWFQEKYTPKDSEEQIRKTEQLSGSLNMLKETFTVKHNAKNKVSPSTNTGTKCTSQIGTKCTSPNPGTKCTSPNVETNNEAVV